MEKVNLDLEYDKWREKNEDHLIEKFLDTHNFENYLEEAWQEYQQENDLFDKSYEGEENEQTK